MINFANIDDNPYFDLTKKDLNEISIRENKEKSSCYTVSNSSGHIYRDGFILLNNPKVKFCCKINFFPSKNTGKYIPRPTFFKIDNNSEVKQTDKSKVIVEFNDTTSAENFWKLIGFINKFKDLVEVEDFDKSYSVVSKDAFIVEFDNKKTADKVKDLQELFAKTNFSEKEIETILKEDRKKNLDAFRYLLDHPDSWQKYFDKYKGEMKGTGEEAVWHHFLKKHHWLLGLNTDLRFTRDFIDEADVGIRNTDGKGSPKIDFLGLSDFTTMVEIKTPNTKIFTAKKRSTSRTNTWSLSDDFIDGISQCLAQKTEWEKNHKNKSIVSNDEIINQDLCRTVDPKVIFIIGNKKQETPDDSTNVDIIIQRDTFERFRRNNRNIDILTYDELYERAYYIVFNKPC